MADIDQCSDNARVLPTYIPSPIISSHSQPTDPIEGIPVKQEQYTDPIEGIPVKQEHTDPIEGIPVKQEQYTDPIEGIPVKQEIQNKNNTLIL